MRNPFERLVELIAENKDEAEKARKDVLALIKKAFDAGFSEGYHCEDNPADSDSYFQEFINNETE
jgi:predicted GNAT superfamily acetyltransferase